MSTSPGAARGGLAPTGLVAWLRSVGRRERRVTALDAVVATALLYVVVVTFMRFFHAFFPWTMEGDWKQWIWQYHRYWTDGAFPPGHVITDYQFRVQPPFYYVVMSALSHVMHPGVAARALSVLTWAAVLVGAYQAAARAAGNWLAGIAAIVIVAHDLKLFTTTMGGYPRSFAPALVFLFIAAWLAREHRWVCALLVLMAGLYPSILPPCGAAYGAWTLFAARHRLLSTVATGGVCGALALLQNFALPWWGHVITLDEAQSQSALWPGGRMHWLPLADFWGEVRRWSMQPFDPAGALPHYELWPWSDFAAQVAGVVVVLALVALVVRRGGRVPREIVLLMIAAVATYFVARVFAFRLYLPLRVIQHVLPYCVIILLPVLAFEVARARVGRALVMAWAPIFLIGGDGFLFPGWGQYDDRARQLTWIEENTPVTAQLAGDIQMLDVIPYFCARQVYVNWTMAHPFRDGYWREMERRLLRNFDALYSNDKQKVVRFIEEEKIDYLVIDRARFSNPELGRKLFHPVRSWVESVWAVRKKNTFVLGSPPPEAVVLNDDGIMILDARKLVEIWR